METGLRVTAITLHNGHHLDGDTPFLKNFSAENKISERRSSIARRRIVPGFFVCEKYDNVKVCWI